MQPNFGQNFEWTRQIHGTANPGAQEATSLLTVFCFVSACLHRALTQHLEKIKKLVVGFRTSSQDKEKKRGSTTTANARTDPTILVKTSHKTPTSAITRQTHHLELVRKFRPTSTSPLTPEGTRSGSIGLTPHQPGEEHQRKPSISTGRDRDSSSILKTNLHSSSARPCTEHTSSKANSS